MSVIFTTGDPHGLLAVFNTAMKKLKDEPGFIGTWEQHHSQRTYYTLTTLGWRAKMWFRADVGPLTLTFVATNDPGTPITNEVYEHYHAQLLKVFEQFSYRYADVKSTPKE